MSDETTETIQAARKALADKEWVAWAPTSGDGNEGALLFAYRAIVELANRLGVPEEENA